MNSNKDANSNPLFAIAALGIGAVGIGKLLSKSGSDIASTVATKTAKATNTAVPSEAPIAKSILEQIRDEAIPQQNSFIDYDGIANEVDTYLTKLSSDKAAMKNPDMMKMKLKNYENAGVGSNLYTQMHDSLKSKGIDSRSSYLFNLDLEKMFKTDYTKSDITSSSELLDEARRNIIGSIYKVRGMDIKNY